jgi:hypothetical protein
MSQDSNEKSEDGPSLKIAFINARGLVNRVDRINDYWKRNPEVKVMVIVETWLKVGQPAPRFAEATLAVDSRCATVGSRGNGGMIILVRTGLDYDTHRADPHFSIVSVGNLRIIGCYFPPYYGEVSKEQEKMFLKYWKIIEGESLLNSNSIVLGDFNAHGLHQDKINARGTWIKAHLRDSSLVRIHPSRGRWTTISSTGMGITDHIFANRHSVLKFNLIVDESQSFGGSDHRLLELEVSNIEPLKETYVERFNTRNISEKKEELCSAIRAQLSSQDDDVPETLQGWISSARLTTAAERIEVVDKRWNQIFTAVTSSVVKVLGKYRIKPMERRNFLTKRMEEKRKEWDIAIEIAQKATLEKAPRETLKVLWRRVGDISRWWFKRVHRRRNVVFSKIIDTLHSETPQFQKMVSCIKKREQRDMGKCQLDPTNMTTHSQYFESTFGAAPTGQANQVDHSLLDRTNPAGDFQIFERPTPSEDDIARIERLLCHLPNGKAAGEDQVPGEIWKAIASDKEIVLVLSNFFHLCQTLATTPTGWKVALIVPIYKQKGNALDISNYRPIALTQVIRRVYEQYNLPLLESVEEFLNNTQGGFRKNRSTFDQILIVNEFLARFKINAVIYLDIKAAYDTVDRRILWTRMKEKFKLDDDTIKIIRELFDLNVTKLVIKNQKSGCIKILRGLLQGSSLSPLLFNIFINSLLDELHKLPKQKIADCLLINNAFFADDGALLVTNNKDAATLTTATYQWSIKNGIEFAIPKCQFVGSDGYDWKISMNGVPIERVNTYKYLGIFNNASGIDWPLSTNHRIGKFKNMVQFLNRKGLNPTGWRLQQRLTTYKSFLRPMLEYGMALRILPRSSTDNLQRAQNYALRMMLRGSRNTATTSMHIILDLETVQMRNTELNARYFNSLFNSEKATHPVGILARHIFTANLMKSGSLLQTFKKTSPYAGAVFTNKLPPLDDLKKLRIENLHQYQASMPHTSSSRLHCPQGLKMNNIVKEGWKLPRSTINAIIDFKLNKLPRIQCLVCKGLVSLGHLLNCGELETVCESITLKHQIDLSSTPTTLQHHIDKLLWWMDDNKKPNMTIYKEIGESIIAAKRRILSTEREPVTVYSDDSDPEEYYTAQLNAKGVKKGFQPAPTETPPTEADTPRENVAWVRGPDLQTVSELPTPPPDIDEAMEATHEDPEDPVESMRVDYLLFWSGFLQWERPLKMYVIKEFLTDNPPLMEHRKALYDNLNRHGREKTLWTTTEGIEALSQWIAAFRYWNMPPSWRQDRQPQRYVRDIPKLGNKTI